MQDVNEDKDEYAFIVKSASQPGKIEVFISGILVEMVVDSGASTNVKDKHLWSKLRKELQRSLKCVSVFMCTCMGLNSSCTQTTNR